MLNRHNSLLHAYHAQDVYRGEGFVKTEETEAMTLSLEDFKAIVLSGEFDQLAALSLFVLSEWKTEDGFLKGAPG